MLWIALQFRIISRPFTYSPACSQPAATLWPLGLSELNLLHKHVGEDLFHLTSHFHLIWTWCKLKILFTSYLLAESLPGDLPEWLLLPLTITLGDKFCFFNTFHVTYFHWLNQCWWYPTDLQRDFTYLYITLEAFLMGCHGVYFGRPLKTSLFYLQDHIASSAVLKCGNEFLSSRRDDDQQYYQ